MNNLYRSANLRELEQKSEEKRLKFCIVSNDNACERWDWELGRYTEELDPKGAIFSGLKTMFKDHHTSVDNAIAKIENIRFEGGELVCECVFDDTSAQIYERFKSGILSDVSIGYRVIDNLITKKNSLPYVLVKKFEILELSAVWKGADKGASIRSEDIENLSESKNYIEIQKEKLKLKEKSLCLKN